MTIQDIIISTVITILPLWFLIPETNIRCWEVGGVYFDWKIYVCDTTDNEFTKYHEIWHKLWNEWYITDKEKETYTTAYSGALKRWISAFYREYSMTDAEEDGADIFALIMTKDRIKISMKKREKLVLQMINK